MKIGRLTVVPVATEIGPCRIRCFDESDFSGAPPALQFFLPSDGSLDVLMALEPDEAIAVVSRCEAFMLFPFVLEYAFEQITCHANVERSAAAGHHVGAIGALVHALIVGRKIGRGCDEE